MTRPRISLLHATFRRVGGPLEVRDAWLQRAADPDIIEYVVAMDADDDLSVASTEGIPRLVNPALGGSVTAVRNWNAAAAAATGELLVVIADDLFPPPAWDRALLEMTGSLNPQRTAFVVKVADRPRADDVLLRHPVVSRAFYARFGLFSPSYRGVYCDTDFTARAFWHSVILDGRSLRMEHRHPVLDDRVAASESHTRMNRREEYEQGRARYLADWSWRQRHARPLLVPAVPTRRLSHWALWVAQRRLRAAANVHLAARALGRATELFRRMRWPGRHSGHGHAGGDVGDHRRARTDANAVPQA